jgi:hypothetical protein
MYIGSSKSLACRIGQHASHKSLFTDVAWLEFKDIAEARGVEETLISQMRPPWNRQKFLLRRVSHNNLWALDLAAAAAKAPGG